VCREEVDLARGALEALATLEEVPVPLGVTGPVLAEARRSSDRRRKALWGRVQWAAGLAAAAAIAIVVAVNLPAGDQSDERATLGADAGGTAPREETTVESGDGGFLQQPGVNYDEAGIQSPAEAAAADVHVAGEAEAPEADLAAPSRRLASCGAWRARSSSTWRPTSSCS
jgi:hypothetical protein